MSNVQDVLDKSVDLTNRMNSLSKGLEQEIEQSPLWMDHFPEMESGDVDFGASIKFTVAVRQLVLSWLIANHPDFDEEREE